jgi:predicted lipid carrier protein YhbT
MTGENLDAAFWSRRMAHETAVHRADAELANELDLTPMPIDLAIDGVDEFFSLYPSRVLSKTPAADLGGSLHLHATDGHGEWMISLRAGKLTVEHGHGKGDAAVRGPATDLLWGVWGRIPLTGDRFQRFGDESVVRNLESIGAF